MRIKRHLLKATALLASAAVGVGIGVWIRQGIMHQPIVLSKPDKLQSSPKPTLTPEPGLKNEQYSLTIPAQRAREYEGGAVAVEQPLRDAGGFRRGVISYESDGLKQYAQVSAPSTSRPSSGYPVLMLVHGYINPASYRTDEPFYSAFAAAYARKGYLVVKPDLRGHGRSWGVPEGAYYSAGYVADVLNLAASLSNYSEADATRIALAGHSMGGQIALRAALVKPAQFDALVLTAPAAGNISDMYRHWSAYSDFGSPVTLGIRQRVIALFGEPDPKSEFWHEADPYTFLGDLTMPVQVHHARDDNTVPYRFSEQLNEAMKAAGHPADFHAYDHGGHSFDDGARDGLIASSSAFISEPLKS